MTLLLDTGAFLAVERRDPYVAALVEGERRRSGVLVTHGGVVGQAWRGGRDRQVRVARLLLAVDVVGLDGALGRRAGVLLGATGTADVVDAALVALAGDGDRVLTGDVGDLRVLAEAHGADVELVAV